MGKHWHCVYTNIKCEFRARAGLEAKGFEVYLPLMKVLIRHARRTYPQRKPLFTRYLFVRFDCAADEWYEPIKSTDGVEDLLRNNFVPVACPAGVVEKIQEMEAAGEFDYAHRGPHKVGVKVRVTAGPFFGFSGIVQASSASERVELLLSMLGRSVTAKLPLAQVAAV